MTRSFPASWLALLAATCQSHPSPVPVPAPPELPRYSLEVRLTPAEHRIEVDGTVRVPPAQAARDSLDFVLDRALRFMDAAVVEPAALSGPVRMDSVGSTRRDIKYVARLPRPVPSGTPVVVRFACAGGSQSPAPLFYLGGPVVYASGFGTNWYPGLGDGNIRGMGRMRVQAPPTHPTVVAGGARLVARDSAAGLYEFDVNVPTYFSVVAGRFHITRHSAEIPVTVFTLEPRPGAAEQARVAAAVMRVLQHEFGPYRMRELAIIEYPDSLAPRLGFNAVGEPGMLVLKGGFLLGPPSVPNYGHELGHNWWPIVSDIERPHQLMAEALANYAAFRAVEAVQGPVAAERFRRDGDPGFNGEISARFYLTNAAAGFDTTLTAMREGTSPQRNMGGSKGAFVFDMLAAEVGREVFRKAMAATLDRHEWGRISLPALIREIGAAAGQDLEWFYQQWFTRSGAPTFSLEWQVQDRRVTGAVVQPSAPYYRVSLPILIESEDSGAAIRMVRVEGARTAFSFTLPFVASRVEVDPRYRILHWTPERRAAAESLAPLIRAGVHGSLEEFRLAMQSPPRPDVHGFEFTGHLGLARRFMDSGPPDSARVHLEQALSAPSRDAEQLSLVYALLAMLANRAGDTAAVRQAVERAVAADTQAGIAGASVWARHLLPAGARP